MSTLGERIEDLIGVVTDADVKTDSLTDSATDILNSIPDQCLWLVIDETADVTVNPYSIDTCKVMAVTRDGEFCSQAPLAFESRVISSPDSLYAPSVNTPVYILKEGKISVYPTGFTGFKVQKVNYPTVIHTDTNIGKLEKSSVTVTTGALFSKTSHGLSVGNNVTLEGWTRTSNGDPMPDLNNLTTQVKTAPTVNTFTLEGVTTVTYASTGSFVSGVQFPKELEHIVVLGAAIKGRLWQLVSKRGSIPAAPALYSVTSSPGLGAIDTTLAHLPSSFTYAAETAPTAPGVPAFTYTAPTISLTAVPSITDLSISATSPTAPGSPTIAYVAAANADAGTVAQVAVTVPAVSGIAAVSDITVGTAPTYQKPTVSLDAIPTIADLDLSGITVPSLSASTIAYSSATNTDATNADATSTAVGAVTVATPSAVGNATFPALPTAPTYQKPTVTTAFSTVDTYIGTNEDIELAQAKIQEEQARLQEYSIDVQNEMNEFTKDVKVYDAGIKKLDREFEDDLKQNAMDSQNEVAKILKQADVDAAKATQDARQTTDIDKMNKAQDQALSIANKAQDQVLEATNKAKDFEVTVETARHKLALHQADIQKYQQEVASAVQEYRVNEIEVQLASWKDKQIHILDLYAKDIQNELNEYNKDNVKYQTEFQAEVEEMKVHLARNQADLNKELARELKKADIDLSASSKDADLAQQKEISNKSQDQALDIQNKAKALEAQIADWNADIQKYQHEIAQYQADVNAEVQEYTINEIQKQIVIWQGDNTQKIQSYGAEIQNAVAAYKEKVDEYQGQTGTFSAELQEYATSIQQAGMVYKVNLDKSVTELQQVTSQNQNIIANNGSLLEAWSQKNSLELNNFSALVQKYQTDTGRYVQEHGLMMQEMAQLQSQYQASMQQFVSKYTPTPGVQGSA